MSEKREQLIEIMQDAENGETKADLRGRIADLECELAALRAAVPEGEPVAFISDSVLECLRRGTGGLFRMDTPKWKGDEQVIPLYTHPAPRPDMERELAEARNHVAELELERERFATENLALAADNARLEEDITRKDEALEHARHLMWTYGFSENNLQPIRLALSGASIPADKAEERREALEEAEAVAENELQEIADGAWGDNPARRGAARALISQEQPK